MKFNYYMKKIDAVAFDLDHTLYDRNATWRALTEAVKRELLPKSKEIFTQELCHALQKADRISTYAETSWRGMLDELKRDGILPCETPYAEFDAFIRHYFPGAIVPYSDTGKVLRWCREKGLGPSLITNGHAGLQEQKLEAMGLTDAFQVCIICNLDDGSPCKPQPAPFLTLAETLALPPERIIYVGDNPVNDIAGAAGCGMQTAWLNVMNNWRPGVPAPTYEISTLSELMSVLSDE